MELVYFKESPSFASCKQSRTTAALWQLYVGLAAVMWHTSTSRPGLPPMTKV